MVYKILLSFLLIWPLSCAHRGNSSPSTPSQDPIITQTDFSLYSLSLPKYTQEGLIRDPEEYRKQTEEFVRKWLYAKAAQESGHPALDSLRRRAALLDKMVVAQFYQWIFMGENLGATRGEIESYYKRYPEKFRDSTGQLIPFRSILDAVADTMAIAKANLDSFYTANSENYALSQPDLRRRMTEKYLLETKERRSENTSAELKRKYQVRLVRFMRAPTETEIADYYNQNKDAYQSPDGFELYHIETIDAKNVREKWAAVKSLKEFQTLVRRYSVNTWTKPLGGRLGAVKRDFCLPFGIGMMPTLFPALDAIQGGKISEAFQSTETGNWHYFWLEKKLPRTQKPLSRVKVLVAQDLLTNGIASITPEDTLAVIPGRKAILEKDVVFFRDEYPIQLRSTFTRENLVNFLLEREVIMEEAEALGLFEDERLKGLRYAQEVSFWSQFYKDSLLHPAWHGDTAAMSSLFSRKPFVFTLDPGQKDWRVFGRELAAYSLLSPTELDIEYRTNRERYQQGDSLPPLSQVEFDVFQSLKSDAYRRLDAKVTSALRNRFRLRIDSSIDEPRFETPDKALKEADSLYRDRKLDRALYLYSKLHETFPQQAALQCSVTMNLAKIHLERKHFQPALSEYRRASLLYPEAPSRYKALFMEGFILAEHFKSDSAAVRVFEAMLKEYPESELSKEADWMVRNIRSGGALMSVPKEGN